MRGSELERLRKELLSGDEAGDLRESSLEVGLQFLRLRRRRKRFARGCAVVLSLVVLAFFLHSQSSDFESERSKNHSRSANATTAGARDEELFVTDEELFRLFPDRSMALIGKDGQQKVIFLDSE